MPKFILDNMSKDQLQHLSHHLINNSPLGIIIMDDTFRVVFLNDVVKRIFSRDLTDASPFLGELFQCKFIAGTDFKCGSRRQCNNCKIRNSLLNASYFNRVVDHISVKHTFIIKEVETIKWFDITVIPTTVDRSPHLVLVLNDQTDMMNQLIEDELSEVLTQLLSPGAHDDTT